MPKSKRASSSSRSVARPSHHIPRPQAAIHLDLIRTRPPAGRGAAYKGPGRRRAPAIPLLSLPLSPLPFAVDSSSRRISPPLVEVS